MEEIGMIQANIPTRQNICYENHLRGLLDEQYQREQILWRQKFRKSWLTQKRLKCKILLHVNHHQNEENFDNNLKPGSNEWTSDQNEIGDMF